MVVHFIDETLPAHDPNFPKPRGLLPVPPEVAEIIASYEAELIRKHGTSCTPEARQWMLDNDGPQLVLRQRLHRLPSHARGRRGSGGGLGGGSSVPRGAPRGNA